MFEPLQKRQLQHAKATTVTSTGGERVRMGELVGTISIHQRGTEPVNSFVMDMTSVCIRCAHDKNYFLYECEQLNVILHILLTEKKKYIQENSNVALPTL